LALFVAPAARAADPVNPSNTAWQGIGPIKAKIPGAGSPAGEVDVDVLFGPNAGAASTLTSST
jgi:hypothetical protein